MMTSSRRENERPGTSSLEINNFCSFTMTKNRTCMILFLSAGWEFSEKFLTIFQEFAMKIIILWGKKLTSPNLTLNVNTPTLLENLNINCPSVQPCSFSIAWSGVSVMEKEGWPSIVDIMSSVNLSHMSSIIRRN